MAMFLKKKMDLYNGDEIPDNFNVSNFIFTRKTITYDGKTLQLRNVTKISKYNYSNTIEPTFDISDETLWKSKLWGVGALIVYYFLSGVEIIGILCIGVVLIAAGINVYGYNERNKKKTIHNKYYGLVIHSSSGKSENLLTNNKRFINKLFNEITIAMNDEGFSKMVANFNNHEIIYQDNKKIEKVIVGDNFEEIKDSNIVNRSTINDEKLELEALLENIDEL